MIYQKSSLFVFIFIVLLHIPLTSCESIINENASDNTIKVEKSIEKKTINRSVDVEREVEIIKRFEGFSDTVYNTDGNETIGYGFRTKYWYKGNTITKDSAEMLLYHIFEVMEKRAKKDFPNTQQAQKIAHLYFWLGTTGAKRFIENDSINTLKMCEVFRNNKGLLKRVRYFM